MHGTLSYLTVTRWIKRFKSGIDSVDSAPGRGRHARVVTAKITDKVNDLLKIDARMTTRQIARCLCISTGSTSKISKKKLRVSRIAARWIPQFTVGWPKERSCFDCRKNAKEISSI